MKRTTVAGSLLLAVILSGCGDPADRVEGTYSGLVKAWIGRPITVLLVFRDDTATLMSDRVNQLASFHVERDENRVILSDAPGKFGTVFMVDDDGKTLTCKSCETMSLPKTWEYVGPAPEILTRQEAPPPAARQDTGPGGLPSTMDLNRQGGQSSGALAAIARQEKPRPTPKPKPTPSPLTRSIEGGFVGLGYDSNRKLPVRLSIRFGKYDAGASPETATMLVEDPYGRQEQTLLVERGVRDTIRLRPGPEAYGDTYDVVVGEDGQVKYLISIGGLYRSEILLPEAARHAASGDYPIRTQLGLIDWPGLTPPAEVSGTFRKGSRRLRIEGDTMTFDHMLGVSFRFKLDRGKHWIVAKALDEEMAGNEFSIAAKENGRWLFIRKLKGPNNGAANALVETWKKEGGG